MIERNILLNKIELTLGRVTDYNSNSNEFRKITEKLLDNVIYEMAHNQNYTFNQVTVQLTYFQKEQENGMYKYNKPFDFLNFAGSPLCYTEGEFIYSEVKDLSISYNRTIELTEFPNYMLNLLRFETLKEIAFTYPQYRDRTQEFMSMAELEKSKILTNESKPVKFYNRRYNL